MSAVLLSGVVLNWIGAAKLFGELQTRSRSDQSPGDYEQLKLFVAGTAAVFGSLYLYLFIEPQHVVPFLIFGAGLKSWAFVLSVLLRIRGRLDAEPFWTFGVSNLVVAVLFWILLISEAG